MESKRGCAAFGVVPCAAYRKPLRAPAPLRPQRRHACLREVRGVPMRDAPSLFRGAQFVETKKPVGVRVGVVSPGRPLR